MKANLVYTVCTRQAWIVNTDKNIALVSLRNVDLCKFKYLIIPCRIFKSDTLTYLSTFFALFASRGVLQQTQVKNLDVVWHEKNLPRHIYRCADKSTSTAICHSIRQQKRIHSKSNLARARGARETYRFSCCYCYHKVLSVFQTYNYVQRQKASVFKIAILQVLEVL